MSGIKHFLLVDDDPNCHSLSRLAIRRCIKEAELKVFTDPEEALSDLQHCISEYHEHKTILLLDLNMPTMSGWEFLDKFDLLDMSVKNNYEIYVLSSSIDERDLIRAKENPLIKNYLEKPLTKTFLQSIEAE